MFKVQYLSCNMQWESSNRWLRVVKNVSLSKAVTICNGNIMQLPVIVSKGSIVIVQLCESLHHHWSSSICHGFRANGYVELEIGLFFFSPWDFLWVVLIISLIIITKVFNTNLVHFLPPYHVNISNVNACSFTCTFSYVHGRAPKKVFRARNLVYEKL